MFLEQHGFEVGKILFPLQTLDTLLLILLYPAHLGINLAFLSLKFGFLLVLFSLTKVLIHTLVKVEILQKLVSRILS
jgi:hypothetical protein